MVILDWTQKKLYFDYPIHHYFKPQLFDKDWTPNLYEPPEKKYQNLELEIEPWPKFYRNNLWTVEQFQSSHFLRNPSFGTYFESSPKTHISNMELTYHYQKPQSMNLHTINGTIVHTSKQDYYIKYICIRILGKSNNLHTGPSFSTLNSVYIRRNQSPHTHSLYLIVPS